MGGMENMEEVTTLPKSTTIERAPLNQLAKRPRVGEIIIEAALFIAAGISIITTIAIVIILMERCV